MIKVLMFLKIILFSANKDHINIEYWYVLVLKLWTIQFMLKTLLKFSFNFINVILNSKFIGNSYTIFFLQIFAYLTFMKNKYFSIFSEF